MHRIHLDEDVALQGRAHGLEIRQWPAVRIRADRRDAHVLESIRNAVVLVVFDRHAENERRKRQAVVRAVVRVADRRRDRFSVARFDRSRHQIFEPLLLLGVEGDMGPGAVRCSRGPQERIRGDRRSLEGHLVLPVRLAAPGDQGQLGGFLGRRLVRLEDPSNALQKRRAGKVWNHGDAVVQENPPQWLRRIPIDDD